MEEIDSINSAGKMRWYNVVAAVLLAVALGVWVQTLSAARREPFSFDDAYMFARYAAHVRMGLGVAWNLNGGHTYGETSLLWGLVVVVLSYLPLGPWAMLTLGSWLCSVGAVIAMAWAVAGEARTVALKSVWRVLPLVALPLMVEPVFSTNQATGMETMLAAMLAAVFLGTVLGWRRGVVLPEIAGGVGLLLFLTRPDAGVVVVLLPVMMFSLMRSEAMRWSGLARLLGVFGVGVALELVACKMYFHTALPLSFYMKGHNAYQGYVGITHPGQQTISFLIACELFFLVLVFVARKADWRLVVCCMVPPLVVFFYLRSVVQIMGGDARYYAPYFAFFVVPSLMVLDRWLSDAEGAWTGRSLRVRSVVAGLVVVSCLVLSSDGVKWWVRRVEKNSHMVYVPATLVTKASEPLPFVKWETAMTEITDVLVAPLPKGATVAATEVGYLGARAPQVNVIDMAGLNDTEIALHGFDVHGVLARKPDLIWMPNSDYTYYNAWMNSNPEVLAEYDVYAGAGDFGLAIRKDSPYKALLDKQMAVFFADVYPHYAMSDYLVLSASWTQKQVRFIDD